MTLLYEWWGQVWPNLAASVLTLPPAFWWHHSKVRRHIEKLSDK